MAPKRKPMRVTSMLCLGIVMVVSSAEAGILDDIKTLAATARERATQARDRAIQARDRAADALESANEVRDEIKDAKARVTDEMRTLVDEAAEDLQRIIMESLEGRADFIADGGCSKAVCEPFRQDLVTLFREMEKLLNSLYGVAGMDGMHVDFQRLISLIEDLPGRALYPVYRVMSADNSVFQAGLLDRLSEATDSLKVIEQAMSQLRSRPVARSDDSKSRLDLEIENCIWWGDNLESLQAANRKVVYLGMILDALGGICQTLAWYLPANPEIDVGAGFLMVWFKWNILEMPAEIFGGLAQAMFMADNFISDQTQHCSQITATGDVRDVVVAAKEGLLLKQMEIRAEQDEILALQRETLDVLGGHAEREIGGTR